MRESQVQTGIKSRLEGVGYLVVKITVCSLSGFPDLICLRNGRVVFIEVKATGKKASPLQEHIHTRLRLRGFSVFVLDDVELIHDLGLL